MKHDAQVATQSAGLEQGFDDARGSAQRSRSLCRVLRLGQEVRLLSLVFSLWVHLTRSHRTLDKLGGKSRIMGLLNHADADVKYRALIATQRCIFAFALV